MLIIRHDTELLKIPRAQIELKGITLPADLEFEIGIGWNHDSAKPSYFVRLTFIRPRARRVMGFERARIPSHPLEGAFVSARDLLDGLTDGERRPRHLLDLAANRTYTPAVRIKIERDVGRVCFRLTIGEWEAAQIEKVYDIHQLFDLYHDRQG